MQAVILAGGLATRLRPLTLTTPKALIPVRGEPFLGFLLRKLASSGVTDIVLCIAHLGEQIEAFAGDGSPFGVHIRYSHEGKELLGTGGALRAALPMLEDAFLVTYGDSYLPFAYEKPLASLRAHSDCDAVMAVFHNRGAFDASNVRLTTRNGETWVETYEKGTKDPSFEHIDYGVLALRKSVLEAAPAGQAFGLDSVQHTLSVQGRVRAVVAETRFYEIGTPDGLRDFEAYLGAGEGDLALGNDERLA